jgi:hypothetical protein
MEARSPAQHVNDTPQGPGIDMLVDQQTTAVLQSDLDHLGWTR